MCTMRLPHLFCLSLAACSFACGGGGSSNPSSNETGGSGTPDPGSSGSGSSSGGATNADGSGPRGDGGSGGGSCSAGTCAELGFNCGSANDGCGGSLECGTCTGSDTCGGGGKANVCGAGSSATDGGHDSGGGSPPTDAGSSSGGSNFIQAAFNGTDNETIVGTSPDKIDLPGGKYLVDEVNVSAGDFASFVDTGAGNPAPALHLYDVGGSSGSVAISISSAGSYVKPAELSIQADVMTLNPSTVLFLGFYPTPPATGTDSLKGLTGLALHTDTGSLDLVEAGVVKTNIAYTGKFNAGAFSTLTYSINTSTGAISSVTLTGSKSTYDFSSTAFTNSATAYAAVGTEAGGPSGACSYFDNLILK
jgi:hypothetical protein